ncbi:hypothetical protein H6P81_014121 [Aristolochia fimbriata]|uniref:Uncharacterized protein n=1 Tax=Aristolochia fimbriata TaxID=158543 RepID=A0AAV7ELA5_ARIFI|nr:hypothetical protein H6P81_014121 [Aristolochia fimbriata]
MALNFAASTSLPTPSIRNQGLGLPRYKPLVPNDKAASKEKQFSLCAAAKSEGLTEESSLTESPERSSTRTQLDLLEQLTSTSTPTSGYESDGISNKPTIRDQLFQLVGGREGDFSLPLGKKLKASMNSLTISQKRNIKRQAYLDKVSRRNDSRFFATVGAFVLLPPILILAVAVLTGYVQLFP